jgi:hypothetical protein
MQMILLHVQTIEASIIYCSIPPTYCIIDHYSICNGLLSPSHACLPFWENVLLQGLAENPSPSLSLFPFSLSFPLPLTLTRRKRSV